MARPLTNEELEELEELAEMKKHLKVEGERLKVELVRYAEECLTLSFTTVPR